jgi:hypothetical protein
VEGAIFALLGLLMAFTFSGAASRFHEKRMLIGEEAHTIDAAYLLVQTLPAEAQPNMRELFRRYIESRLTTYRLLPDVRAQDEIHNTHQIEEEIWNSAMASIALPDARQPAGLLFPPALTDMFGMFTKRTVALHLHPPTVVYLLLFCLSLIASLFVGFRMSGHRRSWLHVLGFTTMTVIIAYVMLDVEYPRTGLIRLDDADAFLVEVRENMK